MSQWQNQYNNPGANGATSMVQNSNMGHTPCLNTINTPAVNTANINPINCYKHPSESNLVPAQFQQQNNIYNGSNMLNNCYVSSIADMQKGTDNYTFSAMRNSYNPNTASGYRHGLQRAMYNHAGYKSNEVALNQANHISEQPNMSGRTNSMQGSVFGPRSTIQQGKDSTFVVDQASATQVEQNINKHMNSNMHNHARHCGMGISSESESSLRPISGYLHPAEASNSRNVKGVSQSTNMCHVRQGIPPLFSCVGFCHNRNTNSNCQDWNKHVVNSENIYCGNNVHFGNYKSESRRYPSKVNYRKEKLNSSEWMGLALPSGPAIDNQKGITRDNFYKEHTVPKNYNIPSGVIHSYQVQNYNSTGQYQSSIKELEKRNGLNTFDSSDVKQEQCFMQYSSSKSLQHQNGNFALNSMPILNVNSNIGELPHNAYNQQPIQNIHSHLPQNYPEITESATTFHGSKPETIGANLYHETYQQKIAMQKFSIETRLRELSKIPGYQMHPKYNEYSIKYKELLKSQYSEAAQNYVQHYQGGTLTSATNAPIEFQFNQNGTLGNSVYKQESIPYDDSLSISTNKHDKVNEKKINGKENSNVAVSMEKCDLETQQKAGQGLNESGNNNILTLPCSISEKETESPGKNSDQANLAVTIHTSPSFDTLHHKDIERATHFKASKNITIEMQSVSKEGLNKPKLDVREFLANWAETEDEDGTVSILSESTFSNSTPIVIVSYENVQTPNEHTLEVLTNVVPTTHDEQNIKKSHSEMVQKPNNETTKTPESSTGSHIGSSTSVDESICIDSKKVFHQSDANQNFKSEAIRQSPNDCSNAIEMIDFTEEINNTVNISKDQIVEIENNQETIAALSNGTHLEETIITKSQAEAKSIEGLYIKYTTSLPNTNEEKSDINTSTSNEVATESMAHIDVSTSHKLPTSSRKGVDHFLNVHYKKQANFINEESHNPDDISLPDIVTSECTPISTTLNTPIHSDVEETSQQMKDVAESIEIVESSSVIGFEQSSVKAEPYKNINNADDVNRSLSNRQSNAHKTNESTSEHYSKTAVIDESKLCQTSIVSSSTLKEKDDKIIFETSNVNAAIKGSVYGKSVINSPQKFSFTTSQLFMKDEGRDESPGRAPGKKEIFVASVQLQEATNSTDLVSGQSESHMSMVMENSKETEQVSQAEQMLTKTNNSTFVSNNKNKYFAHGAQSALIGDHYNVVKNDDIVLCRVPIHNESCNSLPLHDTDSDMLFAITKEIDLSNIDTQKIEIDDIKSNSEISLFPVDKLETDIQASTVPILHTDVKQHAHRKIVKEKKKLAWEDNDCESQFFKQDKKPNGQLYYSVDMNLAHKDKETSPVHIRKYESNQSFTDKMAPLKVMPALTECHTSNRAYRQGLVAQVDKHISLKKNKSCLTPPCDGNRNLDPDVDKLDTNVQSKMGKNTKRLINLTNAENTANIAMNNSNLNMRRQDENLNELIMLPFTTEKIGEIINVRVGELQTVNPKFNELNSKPGSDIFQAISDCTNCTEGRYIQDTSTDKDNKIIDTLSLPNEDSLKKLENVSTLFLDKEKSRVTSNTRIMDEKISETKNTLILKKYEHDIVSQFLRTTNCSTNSDLKLNIKALMSLSPATQREQLQCQGYYNNLDDFQISLNEKFNLDIKHAVGYQNTMLCKEFINFDVCQNNNGFVNPIFANTDKLDKWHVIPSYMTRDGKISYSPNPTYIYQKLLLHVQDQKNLAAAQKLCDVKSQMQSNALAHGHKNQSPMDDVVKRISQSAYEMEKHCNNNSSHNVGSHIITNENVMNRDFNHLGKLESNSKIIIQTRDINLKCKTSDAVNRKIHTGEISADIVSYEPSENKLDEKCLLSGNETITQSPLEGDAKKSSNCHLSKHGVNYGKTEGAHVELNDTLPENGSFNEIPKGNGAESENSSVECVSCGTNWNCKCIDQKTSHQCGDKVHECMHRKKLKQLFTSTARAMKCGYPNKKKQNYKGCATLESHMGIDVFNCNQLMKSTRNKHQTKQFTKEKGRSLKPSSSFNNKVNIDTGGEKAAQYRTSPARKNITVNSTNNKKICGLQSPCDAGACRKMQEDRADTQIQNSHLISKETINALNSESNNEMQTIIQSTEISLLNSYKVTEGKLNPLKVDQLSITCDSPSLNICTDRDNEKQIDLQHNIPCIGDSSIIGTAHMRQKDGALSKKCGLSDTSGGKLCKENRIDADAVSVHNSIYSNTDEWQNQKRHLHMLKSESDLNDLNSDMGLAPRIVLNESDTSGTAVDAVMKRTNLSNIIDKCSSNHTAGIHPEKTKVEKTICSNESSSTVLLGNKTLAVSHMSKSDETKIFVSRQNQILGYQTDCLPNLKDFNYMGSRTQKIYSKLKGVNVKQNVKLNDMDIQCSGRDKHRLPVSLSDFSVNISTKLDTNSLSNNITKEAHKFYVEHRVANYALATLCKTNNLSKQEYKNEKQCHTPYPTAETADKGISIHKISLNKTANLNVDTTNLPPQKRQNKITGNIEKPMFKKVPNVIIRRLDTGTEFKCEFSKRKCSVFTSTKWQPIVKLKRFKILDHLVRNSKELKLNLAAFKARPQVPMDGALDHSGKSLSLTGVENVQSHQNMLNPCDAKSTFQSLISKDKTIYNSNEFEIRECASDLSKETDNDQNVKKNYKFCEMCSELRICSKTCHKKRIKDISANELDKSSIDTSKNLAKSNTVPCNTTKNNIIVGNGTADNMCGMIHDIDSRQSNNKESKIKFNKRSNINSTCNVRPIQSFDQTEIPIIKIDSSDESQTTIEIVRASPEPNEVEPGIKKDMFKNMKNGVEQTNNIIPMQLELKLDDIEGVTRFSDSGTLKSTSSPRYLSDHQNNSDLDGPWGYPSHNCKTTDICSILLDKKYYVEEIKDDKSKNQAEYSQSEYSDCNSALVTKMLAAKEALKKCLAISTTFPRNYKSRRKISKEGKHNLSFDKCNSLSSSDTNRNICKYRILDITNENGKPLMHLKNKPLYKHPKVNPDKNCDSTKSIATERYLQKKEKNTMTTNKHFTESCTPCIHLNSIDEDFTTISLKSSKPINNKNTALLEGDLYNHKQTVEEDDKVEQISHLKPEEEKCNLDKDPMKCKTKEDKMPVLLPEVAVNIHPNSDRDSSRSPPVITNEGGTSKTAPVKNKLMSTIEGNEYEENHNKEMVKMSFADIVTQLAYHEKATIKHRRYCNLCERWFPTTLRHKRHLAGYQHRHIEFMQRKSIHALFLLFTGNPCPKLLPANIVRDDYYIGELTPLQLAVQDITHNMDHSRHGSKNSE